MSPERRLHGDQGCRMLPAHSLAEGHGKQKGHCPAVGQGRTRGKAQESQKEVICSKWGQWEGVARDQVSRVATEVSSGQRVGE